MIFRLNKTWLRAMAIMGLIMAACYHLPAQGRYLFSDSAAFFKKVNDVQIVDYTPKNGKDGKDVDFMVELITLGVLNKNGKKGNDGPDLKVMVATTKLYNRQLLLLTILNPGTQLTDSFYVNPEKGQIKIIADGANGGAGGRSSKGVEGDKGKAGKGGSIEVILDSTAAGFARCSCLLFSNKDGKGIDAKETDKDELLLYNGQLLRPFDKPVKWTVKQ